MNSKGIELSSSFGEDYFLNDSLSQLLVFDQQYPGLKLNWKQKYGLADYVCCQIISFLTETKTRL